jgi:hypothetical protein
MQIFATFEYSNFLELAITELEGKGIKEIYAVPLNLRQHQPRLMDSIHRADGISHFDKAMILAFMFATIGASKGFVWAWGPIVWGLIGAAAGFVTGVLLNIMILMLMARNNKKALRKGGKSEVILIVGCEEREIGIVEDILWSHRAIGLAKTL